MKRGGRIKPVSDKRQAHMKLRRLVVEIVHQRADHRCWYAHVVPEIRCERFDFTRPEFEVDELRGGAQRLTEWTDPDRCRLTCQSHHRYKTEHKLTFLDRLARYERKHPWPSQPSLPTDPSDVEP